MVEADVSGLKLGKKTDYVWEIPKSGNMGVPAVVFASERMLDKMRSDRTLKQLCNVASLPGIVRAAYVMPDGHEGYGFPIGGVAAFRDEEGIISPGGIGYDINCLPGDTKVLDEFGAVKSISSYENACILQGSGPTVLMGMCMARLATHMPNGISSSPASYFMKRKETTGLYRISLKSGHIVRATGDHPIFTKRGMVPAKDLLPGDGVGVTFFEGVEFEDQGDWIIFDGSGLTEARKGELEKRGLLPLAASHPAVPRLARIIGYIIGDGSIHTTGNRTFVSAFGKEEDLKALKKDIEALGFSAGIYVRDRNLSIGTQYGTKAFRSRSAELHATSRAFADLLVALGVPIGKKTSQDFGVPQWIMKSKRWVKRLFLAGFFGAEMSTPKTLSKTAFNCVVVGQNKNGMALDSGKAFLLQVAVLLGEFGVKAFRISIRKEYRNKSGETYRLRLIISGEDNFLKLWRTIGFEYNAKRRTQAEIASAYILLKRKLSDYRKGLVQKIIEYKRMGFRLKELQKTFSSDLANPRFIERAYYEGKVPRITSSFEPFAKFAERKMQEIREAGILFSEIESISFEKFEGDVYDFTVEETHNFIANGVIVSNCGVRLLKTNLMYKDVGPHLHRLINSIYENCPSGVGSKGKVRLDPPTLRKVLTEGVEWAIREGYGWERDRDFIEENGCMKDADPSKVSDMAVSRGKPQLGTIGSGNHFIELQEVSEVLDADVARKFGLFAGQFVIMVHTGSRGLGHQVASDYIRIFNSYISRHNIALADRELVYAHVSSREGQDYINAMNCAVNFAFVNRQLLTHWVRESVGIVLKQDPEDIGMEVLYDVCHNIGKREEHMLEDGRKGLVWVHRKGATRAMPAGRPEVPTSYRDVGQPVIIPGSMGTASYVLVGTPDSAESFHSVCHGAGRVMSRHEAIRSYPVSKVKEQLGAKGIYIRSAETEVISEEAPGAYKDIDEVIDSVVGARLARAVTRMVPHGVVKG